MRLSPALETRIEEVQTLLSVVSQRAMWAGCVIVTPAALGEACDTTLVTGQNTVMRVYTAGCIVGDLLNMAPLEFASACASKLRDIDSMCKHVQSTAPVVLSNIPDRSTILRNQNALPGSTVKSLAGVSGTVSTAVGVPRYPPSIRPSEALQSRYRSQIGELQGYSSTVDSFLVGTIDPPPKCDTPELVEISALMSPPRGVPVPPNDVSVMGVFIAALSVAARALALLASIDSLGDKSVFASVSSAEARLASAIVEPVALAVHAAAMQSLRRHIAAGGRGAAEDGA